MARRNWLRSTSLNLDIMEMGAGVAELTMIRNNNCEDGNEIRGIECNPEVEGVSFALMMTLSKFCLF